MHITDPAVATRTVADLIIRNARADGLEQRPAHSHFHESIAVLVPCCNEALTVADVIASFEAALPTAEIYVYDNNSTDRTAEIAFEAGAIVRKELRRGKGNVVRRMFADIEADIFVLVDGDNTYEAEKAPFMIRKMLDEGLDFVNGARQSTKPQAYRIGHRFGNWFLTSLVQCIFGRHFSDMLSGYKVLSYRFVKSFPAMSSGFEIETEIAVHALELRIPCAEMATAYSERAPGSASKLKTYTDGCRILSSIFRLVKDERPFGFFGTLGTASVATALYLSTPIISTYLETGLVPRLPTAVLSTGLVLLGVISCFAGLILEMVTRTRQEVKRLLYLAAGRRSGTR